jgi:transcriptional regulator with XRE-family HTH domain
MSTLTGTTIDLTTILGRTVAALRQELRHSQASFARVLDIDRSLLARIESGRNTATIDNVFLIEEAFIQAGVLHWHGDMTMLAARIVGEIKQRGGRALYGNLPKPEGDAPLETTALDRIVALVVDGWLQELAEGRRS